MIKELFKKIGVNISIMRCMSSIVMTLHIVFKEFLTIWENVTSVKAISKERKNIKRV